MRLTLPAPLPCDACGSQPVHHSIHYWTLAGESAMAPLLHAALALASWGRRLFPGGSGAAHEFLARAGLGEFLDEPDGDTLLLNRVLWEEGTARGIRLREFRFLGLPRASFVAQFPGGRRMAFESIPFPARMREGAWWIDTKTVMKRKLGGRGIPVARGGGAWTRRGALKLFDALERPVVVKPFHGSASRHTTMHVSSWEELLRAFALAKQVSPCVMVEEELTGSVYRPTLVAGSLIATIRRDPPRVVGDGTRTVEELIEEANMHPKRQGPYFSRIALEAAALQELAYQGLSPQSVPERGRVVNLHQKINWSLGGTTEDVTERVHPDNKALFEDIARILQAPIVGIDFIIEDISRSWKEQKKCGVIECNGRPYFDNHHLPFEGEPRNVAGAIWDACEEEERLRSREA